MYPLSPMFLKNRSPKHTAKIFARISIFQEHFLFQMTHHSQRLPDKVKWQSYNRFSEVYKRSFSFFFYPSCSLSSLYACPFTNIAISLPLSFPTDASLPLLGLGETARGGRNQQLAHILLLCTESSTRVSFLKKKPLLRVFESLYFCGV